MANFKASRKINGDIAAFDIERVVAIEPMFHKEHNKMGYLQSNVTLYFGYRYTLEGDIVFINVHEIIHTKDDDKIESTIKERMKFYNDKLVGNYNFVDISNDFTFG
jgi:hypothetical protein